MANNVANDRYWILDTAELVKAAGVPVIVRKVVFFGTTAGDDLIINDYSPAGVEQPAITLKMRGTEVVYPEIDFGPDGRLLNGMNLDTIDHGAAHIYIGKN